MEHVFVDTNVFLRIFNKTSDTINEVEVLLELIKSKQIKLYTTEQVVEEFYRNVEREVEEAVADIAKIPDKIELPRITQQFEEAPEILAQFNSIRQIKKALLEAVQAAAKDGELRADALVSDIFAAATELERSDEMIERARLRRDLGNPPGKSDSLGDQINWECLLDGVTKGTDLSIICRDSDFSIKLGSRSIKQYLKSEWETEKESSVSLFLDLKEFLSEKFPDAKTPVDAKKNAALKNLEETGSFLTTHRQIAKLSEVFDKLDFKDAMRAFRALIDNKQVSLIATDEDVKDFYSQLFTRYFPKTPLELDEELYAIAPYLDDSEADDDEDVPF